MIGGYGSDDLLKKDLRKIREGLRPANTDDEDTAELSLCCKWPVVLSDSGHKVCSNPSCRKQHTPPEYR